MSQRDALKYAGVQHAKRGWQLHTAKRRSRPTCEAGNPSSATSRPAYTATPRLLSGRCTAAWARTSGSTTGACPVAGRILPPICIDRRHVGGVGVDINDICKPNSVSAPDLYSSVSFQQTFAKRLIGRFLNSRTAPSLRLPAVRSEMAQIFQ